MKNAKTKEAFLGEFQIIGSSISQQGANATVFKVKHKSLEYIRAMKVLHDIILHEKDKKYQNFLKECKLLLRLGNGSCPYIVHISQPRLIETRAMVEMEYIEGQDLNDYIKSTCNGFVPFEEVLVFIQNICQALAYCHFDIYKFCINKDDDNCNDDDDGNPIVLPESELEKTLVIKYQVIHNDLHSKNVMRKKYDGSYVLLDFGLAFEGENVEKKSNNREGALEYKAPEKWNDIGIVKEQSDIYSFGILMYEMLAGSVPFPLKSNSEKNKSELYEAHLNTTPPSIESKRKSAFENNFNQTWMEKDYPDWLEDMVLKCLEKTPEKRFPNAKVLNDFLLTKIKEENPIYKKNLDLEQNIENLITSKTIVENKLAEIQAVKDKIQAQQLNEKVNLQEKKVESPTIDNSKPQKNYTFDLGHLLPFIFCVILIVFAVYAIFERDKISTKSDYIKSHLSDSIKKLTIKINNNEKEKRDSVTYYKSLTERYYNYGKDNGKFTIYSTDSESGGEIFVYIDGKIVGTLNGYYEKDIVVCDNPYVINTIVRKGPHKLTARCPSGKWNFQIEAVENQCVLVPLNK